MPIQIEDSAAIDATNPTEDITKTRGTVLGLGIWVRRLGWLGLLLIMFLAGSFASTVLYDRKLETSMQQQQQQQQHVVLKTEITKTYLQEYFPECVAPNEYINTMIPIRKKGHYIPTTKLDSPPRYDHLSCFAMKARYNCATAPPSPSRTSISISTPQKIATDYKYVWQRSNHTKPCDIRTLVDQVKGPQGIARQLMLGMSRDTHRPHAQKKNHTRPIQVLLEGSSFLRQVFEALICGFQNQITDLKLQYGGPTLNLSEFGTRVVLPDELGSIIDLQRAREEGCHGSSGKKLDKFYHPQVPVPPNIGHCDDNIGMVEFGNAIRFYFIFRPYMRYDKHVLQHILDHWLGVIDQHVDVLVYNMEDKLKSSALLTVGQMLDFSDVLNTLKSLQRRDTGQFFGANNPWITNPPDVHACMPGVPDDEVNILLYLLLGGYDTKKSKLK